MIATDTLQTLLTQTILVDARYKSQQNATGERFNIFQILNVQTDEVRTHSAFLAELLNPNGTHGLGSVFLKLFIQSLDIADMDTEGASVEIEKHIGTINEEYLSGGRIDICIFPKSGRPVFIENKIYAADQKNQLLRYHKCAERPKLIYLTLYGAEPGEYSTGGQLKSDAIQTISYSTDIIAWLEACRKEAVMQPLVRETITQYINLIKKLTGQNTNKLMTEEIKQLLLRSPEHLAGAQNLGNAFNEIRAEVQRAVYEELNNALNKVLKDLVPQPKNNIFMQYRGYDIKFSCETNGTGYLWGFPAYDQNGKGGICKRSEFDEFNSFLRTLDGRFKRSDWWAGWISPPGFTKVENCSAQQLLELTSAAAREELAVKTAKQAENCIKELMQKFGGQ